MQDAIIKGTGNSRYLKSVANFMALYPTYDDFVAALVAGTLPVDLNGINANGWTQQGTPMNKANVLADSTATRYGFNKTATPDAVFNAIKNLIDSVDTKATNANIAASDANTNANGRARISVGSYVGTGTAGPRNPNSLTFGFTPKFLIIWTSSTSDKNNLAIAQSITIFDFKGITSGYTNNRFITVYNPLSNDPGNASIVPSEAYAKLDENTLSWYYTSSSSGQIGADVTKQANIDKTTYSYCAIY